MKMDKNNQIQAVLDLLKSTPTRKEFLDAFKKVVDHSKTIQATNEKEWGLIHKAHKQLSDSIQRQMSAHIEDSKGHLEKVLKRHTDMINAKLASIKDGEDGEPGKNADPVDYDRIAQMIPAPKDVDENKIVDSVLARLPEPKAGKDGKVIPGWGAHPLQIQGSGSVKTKVARVVNFTGATVTQSPDGVTTVAISAGGLNPQTPSGTINGSNVTFTITGSLNALFVNGQFMSPGGVDYTLSGTTITFVTAPPTGSTIYAF